MKQLTDYILPKIKEKYILNDNKNVILEDDYINSSFDKFLKLNNITNVTSNIYKLYIQENFNNNYRRYYKKYQDHLYESILYSYSASNLMKKIYELSSNIHIDNIQYVNNEDITEFSFTVDKRDDLNYIFTNKIISLLHLYNYYLKERTIIKDENNIESYHIVIEPYKPKDITNKIYNKFGGIIYHITSAKLYQTHIKNKELKPKWQQNDTYRDGRIFFIANNDEKKVQSQLKSISNLKHISDPIVLKVNLKEYRNKLRFRIDSSADGFDAYFTEEPIPDFCITCLDINTWKEINDKNNVGSRIIYSKE